MMPAGPVTAQDGRMGDPGVVRSISTEPVDVSEPPSLVDLAVGLAASTVSVVRPVGHRWAEVTRPVRAVVLQPPLVPPRLQPRSWLTRLARAGEQRRAELVRRLSDRLDQLVPTVAQEVLRRMDLTGAVQRWVDLDAVVAGVDVDAVARRLDVEAVIARLDLTRIVQEQVDLDAVVARVDLDAVVADVDIDAVAARLDLDAVIERIDLAGLAEEVIAEIDLPGIIRGSTGSMASDTVTGVRMQSISGDQAIARAVERLRLRRARRESESTAGEAEHPEPDLDVPAQTRPGASEQP
jgi:hypothetical protein